jgi:CRP-like cAMP-binding protein
MKMSADIEELRQLVAGNALFNKLEPGELESLLAIVKETRRIGKDTFLVSEGDEADEIFIVKEGSFEVLKKEEDRDITHRLAVLGPGMSIGEVSLLDAMPRSASVRATEDSAVLVISIRDLESLSQAHVSVDVRMKINLAYEMGRRLRHTNEVTVRTLRENLEEAETRAEMGRFMSRVLIGTCLYMFALGAMKALAQFLPDTTMVTVPILLAFAVGLFINIKSSIYPASAYGFTTKNWRPAVKEAILFSLPVVALIIGVKLVLIHTMPHLEGAPVFDFYQSKGVSLTTGLLAALAYSIFAPIQEMIARSGMQSSFQMFLTGKYKTVVAIFLSTLLFSSTHLHVSFTLAVLVFPLGLFWGWLYSRQPTLIGVTISHVVLGLFGLFVVGFPTR